MQPVKDCIAAIAAKSIFEYILSQFSCPKILMSDRGSHFLNEIIVAFLEKFHMYHQKSTLYHPHANGTVEAFNKILENALMNICNER